MSFPRPRHDVYDDTRYAPRRASSRLSRHAPPPPASRSRDPHRRSSAAAHHRPRGGFFPSDAAAAAVGGAAGASALDRYHSHGHSHEYDQQQQQQSLPQYYPQPVPAPPATAPPAQGSHYPHGDGYGHGRADPQHLHDHYRQHQADVESLHGSEARRAHDALGADIHAQLARAEADFGPLFAASAGLFGNLFSSVERMVDDIVSAQEHHQQQQHQQHHSGSRAARGGSGGSSFYYESRKTTVGPDGKVREETVRTVPGPDGRPRTTRNVREGEHRQQRRHGGGGGGVQWGGQYDMGGFPTYGQQQHQEHVPDVVVEELDEHGNVINSNVPQQQHRVPRIEQGPAAVGTGAGASAAPSGGSWLHNRYQQWRGGRS